jgi:hypothetical protein
MFNDAGELLLQAASSWDMQVASGRVMLSMNGQSRKVPAVT